MSVQDDVKKAIEDVLGPDLTAIKGELKAANVKLDRMTKQQLASLQTCHSQAKP